MEKQQKIENLLNKNRDEIKNPLMQGLLSDENNLSILEQFINDPSNANESKVEGVFQKHYERVQKTKYISNLIYFFSVDFDKKQRKLNDRNLLILDKSTSYDTKTTVKETILDESQEIKLSEKNLLDEVENEKLIKALKTLTDKQLLILNLIYLQELPLKEISIQLKTTPQNISNQHRKALKRLNQIINEEGEHETYKQWRINKYIRRIPT